MSRQDRPQARVRQMPIGRLRWIHQSAPRRGWRPSYALNLSPSQTEGAGNAGCPMHPQPHARYGVVSMRMISRDTAESPGIPHAMVLQIIRDLPGEPGFLAPVVPSVAAHRCPVGLRATPTKLDTSVGVSGPHDFSVRNNAARPARRHHSRIASPCDCLRTRRRRVHRIPPPTSVTIASRPSYGVGCPEQTTYF